MPTDKKIFRAVGDALVGTEEECTIVIFEGAAANGSLDFERNIKMFEDFEEEALQWQQSLESVKSHSIRTAGLTEKYDTSKNLRHFCQTIWLNVS